MTVFLDTVGLLALWDRSDQWHSAASASFSKLEIARANLITSSLVLIECANAAARRPYRSTVSRLRREMEEGARILEPTVEEIEMAWMEFERGSPGSAGIVDHLSFVLMRRAGISKAFTNDQHFRSAGFETLF